MCEHEPITKSRLSEPRCLQHTPEAPELKWPGTVGRTVISGKHGLGGELKCNPGTLGGKMLQKNKRPSTAALQSRSFPKVSSHTELGEQSPRVWSRLKYWWVW